MRETVNIFYFLFFFYMVFGNYEDISTWSKYKKYSYVKPLATMTLL